MRIFPPGRASRTWNRVEVMIHPFERTRKFMHHACGTKPQSLVSFCFKSMVLTYFPRCRDNPATTRVTTRRQWTCGRKGDFQLSVQLLRIAECRVLAPKQKTGVLVTSRRIGNHARPVGLNRRGTKMSSMERNRGDPRRTHAECSWALT